MTWCGLKDCVLARRFHGKAPQQGEERCTVLPAFMGASAEHALDHAPLEPVRPALLADQEAGAHCRERFPKGRIRRVRQARLAVKRAKS